MVTGVSDEQREALFERYRKEVLEPNEEPRVRSLLAKAADDGLAKRAFERCCDIRRGLTNPPGHDQAAWNLFRQVQDLVEAIAPAVLLARSAACSGSSNIMTSHCNDSTTRNSIR
jgi:hypothetical protein